MVNEKKRRQNREAQARLQARRKAGLEEAMRWREVFSKEKPFYVGFTMDEEDNLIPCVYSMTKTPAPIPRAMKEIGKPLVAIFHCMPLSEEEMASYQITVEPRTRVF